MPKRVITAAAVTAAVTALVGKAATVLPPDVTRALQTAARREKETRAKLLLDLITVNAREAARLRQPLCQDTGLQVFLVEQGNDVRVSGDLERAIAAGVKAGTKKYGLRSSLAADPAGQRRNTSNNTPPIIMQEKRRGRKLRITLLPKGGGSENKSRLAMLTPTVGWAGVREFVLETVRRAGADACPPLVVGVGVGGDFDRAAYLAKRALFRPLGKPAADKELLRQEKLLCKEINQLKIGALGFGGATTVLAVHVLSEPCHIASLPVAVNLNCHAARRATVVL